MRLIGLPEYAEDERYINCAKINETGEVADVVALIGNAFEQHDWDYWEKLFIEKDVPYARCNTMEDVMADEEAYANDILRPIHYDSIGDHCITTSPVRMASVGDPEITRAKPLGYDTASVLHDLGYNDSEIQVFADKKYIRCFDGETPESLDEISYGPDHQA